RLTLVPHGRGQGIRFALTDPGVTQVMPTTRDALRAPEPGGPRIEGHPSVGASSESGIRVPGTSSHFLDPTGSGDRAEGRLRYLTGGSGPPLVLLHTVRTQAEHFRHLIPLVQQRYTVYALDLPGMGYSQIVPGASYEEPAMRAAVKRLVTQLN